MANGIRTGDSRGFNKGRSSKVLHTPEESRRIYHPKRCGNNNNDEDNSPKTLYDKNPQDSSQKFRQLINELQLIYELQCAAALLLKQFCIFRFSAFSLFLLVISSFLILLNKKTSVNKLWRFYSLNSSLNHIPQ